MSSQAPADLPQTQTASGVTVGCLVSAGLSAVLLVATRLTSDLLVGTLTIGDPRGVLERDAGRRHNLRLRQWQMQVIVRPAGLRSVGRPRPAPPPVGSRSTATTRRGTTNTHPTR